MLLILLMAAIIIDLVVFVGEDKYLLSLFLVVAETALLSYFFPEVWSFLKSIAWQSIALLYFGIGLAVATGKWLLFNIEIGKGIKKALETFSYDSSKGYTKYAAFLKHIDNNLGLDTLLKLTYVSKGYSEINTKAQMDAYLTPNISKYADRIAAWVVQWPFVVFEILFKNVFIEFSTWVSNLVGLLISKVSREIISKATSTL